MAKIISLLQLKYPSIKFMTVIAAKKYMKERKISIRDEMNTIAFRKTMPGYTAYRLNVDFNDPDVNEHWLWSPYQLYFSNMGFAFIAKYTEAFELSKELVGLSL